ncbi:hypothetical protein OC835_006944 [Tilletia horrida]|nr:hypothetical protein OC835_006944 [Tilletia horrida]
MRGLAATLTQTICFALPFHLTMRVPKAPQPKTSVKMPYWSLYSVLTYLKFITDDALPSMIPKY